MKDFVTVKILFFILLLSGGWLVAGPNQNAAISFDANLNSGNQAVSSIDAPGVDAEIKFEVRVTGCSTLDSYSFELRYHVDDLLYGEFSTKNTPKRTIFSIKRERTSLIHPLSPTATPVPSEWSPSRWSTPRMIRPNVLRAMDCWAK